MKRALFLLMILMPAVAPATDDSRGFAPLFNGKNLDGWVVAGKPEGFRVVDRCIFSDGGKGGEWIRTARQYGNFVLRMEWMLSETGNSGVFIRNGPFANGFEVQLLAPWTPYRDDLHCTCSLYGHVPANPRPDETTLRWRKIEISAVWKQISVSVDGVKCAEADYDQAPSMKDLALAGYLGMQDSHTGEGEWVKFRKIEIRDLDQDPAFVATGLASGDAAVRRAAFDAAVRLGPPMMGRLLDMVAGDDAVQRHSAEMALGRIASNASWPGAQQEAVLVRAALLARVESGNDNGAPDRVVATRMLGIIGRADAGTVSALKKALAGGGAAGDAALEAMQRIPGRAMTDALIESAGRADASRQPAMMLALGALRDEATLPILAKAARAGSGDVQIAAVRALGMLGSARAIPVLRDIGSQAAEPLRSAVVQSLIEIADAKGQNEKARALALQAARALAVTPAQKQALGLSY